MKQEHRRYLANIFNTERRKTLTFCFPYTEQPLEKIHKEQKHLQKLNHRQTLRMNIL